MRESWRRVHSPILHAVRQFLRFVVEETLAGRASEIKEPLVAAHVFNQWGDFDRRTNSIVRAGATHVRRRLRNYYLDEGRLDSLMIELPSGGYVPVIRTVGSGARKPSVGRWRRLAAFRPGSGRWEVPQCHAAAGPFLGRRKARAFMESP